MTDDVVARIEFQLNEMQRKLDAAVSRIDVSVSKIDVASKIKPEKRGRDRIFWGFFLVLLGALWFGNSAGWFNLSVSWWPLMIIAFGIYLILGGR